MEGQRTPTADSRAYAAAALISSLASRQCQAAADEGSSAGATPQLTIPIDQWPSRNGDKASHLCCTKGPLGRDGRLWWRLSPDKKSANTVI